MQSIARDPKTPAQWAAEIRYIRNAILEKNFNRFGTAEKFHQWVDLQIKFATEDGCPAQAEKLQLLSSRLATTHISS